MKPSATTSALRPVLRRELVELRLHHFLAQRLVGLRAEHLREVARLDLAHHHVRIRHRERSAAAVARRPRIGARALRPDAKARTVELEDRATAGRHGVDAHHRRAHAHARHLRLELALELAGVVRHVGGRSTHVEADHLVMAAELGRPGHAHDAAGRARQDGVLALEGVGIGESARRLHEEQLHARHLRGHLLHVPAQDGRQVGVDHRGVATADELHHRARLMRRADLGEARLFRDTRSRLLVRRETVAVHEDDGNAAQPRVVGGPQALAKVRLVQRLDHLALGTDALLGFDHTAVQQLGQHDVAVEQARAILVRDAQRIAKALRRDQQRRLSLALQQRVGRHGRPHLHALDRCGRHRLARLQPQQVPDSGDGGVLVLFGVLRQQLVGEQPAPRLPGHDVGERAAAVDPELPARPRGRIEGSLRIGHGVQDRRHDGPGHR